MMESLGAVFSLSANLLFRSRRTIFMALLSFLPVAASMLLAAVIRFRFGSGAPTGFGSVSQIITFFYLQTLLLVVPLFYGTALIGDEYEEKTITYLFVRPVPRWVIFLGKYLSCLLITTVLLLPSLVLSFFIVTSVDPASELADHLVTLAKDIGILLLGIGAYCSFFGFLGARMKRPLLVGLLFSAAWESVVTYLPGNLNRLTVMHYLQSLLPHPSSQRGVLTLFNQVSSVPTSIFALLLISAGFLALACWTVSSKEYVLEA